MTTLTMFDKIWDRHVVVRLEDGSDLIHIDRHLIHDLSSSKAFSDLRSAGRKVRNPELSLAVMDHIVATTPGRDENSYAKGTPFLRALRRNCKEYGVRLLDLDDAEQGIMHIIGPELGFTLPGVVFACGDSHTCTHGALGAVAFGIGSSDIEHVLATQTLAMRRPKTLRVWITGSLPQGCSAKDLILFLIGNVGAGAGNGFAVEYAGPAVEKLTIESRLTLCNMSVEWGARIGMVAPDDRTYEYLAGRQLAPKGALWERAIADWRTISTDAAARFDREIALDASQVAPQITWGTSPEHAIAVDTAIPDPSAESSPERRQALVRALSYMGVNPGQRLEGLPIHQVFIGSCANSRISDLEAAAAVAQGRRVARGVRAMVVPGSTRVKKEAEARGLDAIFRNSGFEWHESGCSMCAAVNADSVPPFDRCVSTSNRNYEGRQGRNARTHLTSPAMAAAAAVTGVITDVRKLMSA